MKTQTQLIGGVLGVVLAMVGGVAKAESSYGYQSTGLGTVAASARVNLKINVPKLILLRVGSDNTTIDTVTWNVTPAWVTSPATLVSTGVSTNTPWDGAAPTFTSAATGGALTVYAWSNASGSTINCNAGAGMTPATGPTMTNITVTTSGASVLPHPGANLGSCAATSMTANTAYSGQWTYAIAAAANPATWAAGAYTGQVTYTASAP